MNDDLRKKVESLFEFFDAAGEDEAKAVVLALLDERDRLAAVIAQHNLCHDLHGKVNCEDFAVGCAAEIKRIYGRCPWEEERDRLRDELECTMEIIHSESRIAELNEKLMRLRDGGTLAPWPLRTLRERCERAEAERDRIRAVLQSIEWPDGSCWQCHNNRYDGHSPDCPVAAALGRTT